MIEYIGKCLLVRIERRKILVVGDLHLGYEEYMNRTGVFVSRKMLKEMVFYFDKVFEKTGKVDEVVLLGDIKHAFGSIMKQEWSDVLGLLNYLGRKCKKIVIVKGNHDKIIQPLVGKIKHAEIKDFYIASEFCFLHGHMNFKGIESKKINFWIMSHGHPAVKISDGVKVEKYKCFLVGNYKGKEIIILPSFFSYSEGSDPRENDLKMAFDFNFDKFEVKVVQDKSLEVLDFGKLKNLN